MPLACDPTAVQRIVLSDDQAAAAPPTFLYRYLTYRQQIELSRFQESLPDAAASAFEKQEAFLTSGLVGWEHITDPATGQPMPFDPTRILDVVTLTEAQEILSRRLLGNLPDLEAKKKLPSPSASDTARPASPAGDRTGAGHCPTP